jgi:hypothetical protein
MSKTNDPMIDDASFAFLKDLAGRDAVMAAIDLMDDDSEERYRSFYPCGDMLIGLRYRDLDTGTQRSRLKFGRSLKIEGGKIVAEPPKPIHFNMPLVPHHTAHGYGFWHINEEQEMVLTRPLDDKRAVTILIEGFPKRGRKDRFAWFCLECVNPLYMWEVETRRAGLPGYYAAQEDTVEFFNGDEKLRTCGACGAVHPHAYSIFPWTDNDEQRKAREIW